LSESELPTLHRGLSESELPGAKLVNPPSVLCWAGGVKLVNPPSVLCWPGGVKLVNPPSVLCWPGPPDSRWRPLLSEDKSPAAALLRWRSLSGASPAGAGPPA
jgi:hypothetical protein